MVKVLFLVLMVITMMSASVYADNNTLSIRVVTEDAYPLQYLDHGELKGPAVEVIKSVLNRANINYNIEVVPWARAYAIATKHANVLIFSIARSPVREDKFHWLGALMDTQYYFYGLKSQYPNNHYSEQDFKHVRVGTIIDSATFQYLSKQGFTKLHPVANPKQNIVKVKSDRIDVFPANMASFVISCQKFQMDCSQLKPLAPLGLPATKLYFAMSKATSDEVVNRIKQAYQALKRSGEISGLISLTAVTMTNRLAL